MKNLTKNVLFAVLAAVLTTALALPMQPGAAYGEETHEYRVGIDGMMCAMTCASKVREALKGVDGVENVQVNFIGGTATVKMQPGSSLSKTQCEAALAESQYKISSFKETSH